MQDFKGFGLSAALLDAVTRMQYTTPTPVQAQTIPPALQGRDVLATAQTGTGKTAAFGIPMVARLTASPRGSALILTPTRELAVQVLDMLTSLLGKHSAIRTALLIGGESMPAQIAQLRTRPRLLVGTPGRINDLLERGSLMLHDVCFLVLDETDRMLDMGFAPQIDKILKFVPQARQTLMFSATLPDNILKLSSRYLREPVRVAIGAVNAVALKIDQQVVHTTAQEKYDLLCKELSERQGSVIIFVRTKRGADRLADKLSRQKHSAEAIHGNLQQRKRERVIQAFRDREHRIMVATDIAARGLDIAHIEHVINYDLPQCPEDYIHRIGRTARAGAEGSSLCFVTPEDGDKWREIYRMLNPGEAPPRRHPPTGGGRPSANGRATNGGRPANGAPNPASRSRRRRRRPAAATSGIAVAI